MVLMIDGLGPVECLLLDEGVRSINCAHSGGGSEGQFIGTDAHDGPVARVRGVDEVRLLAAQVAEADPEAGEAGEWRTGVVTEGVEVEVVECGKRDICHD